MRVWNDFLQLRKKLPLAPEHHESTIHYAMEIMGGIYLLERKQSQDLIFALTSPEHKEKFQIYYLFLHRRSKKYKKAFRRVVEHFLEGRLRTCEKEVK